MPYIQEIVAGPEVFQELQLIVARDVGHCWQHGWRKPLHSDACQKALKRQLRNSPPICPTGVVVIHAKLKHDEHSGKADEEQGGGSQSSAAT
jgi:hypothetical protein